MKLSEAIQIANNSQTGDGRILRLYIATGFNPLHFQTFLAAHCASSVRLTFIDSPYGDLLESLEAKYLKDADDVATLIEWADIDPRLGYRRLGGWRENELQDILVSASARLRLIEASIQKIAARQRTILCGPTLPLPPAFLTATWQAGSIECQLRALIAGFYLRCAEVHNVVVLSPQAIDLVSPLLERHDINTEFAGDSLYRVSHSDAIAGVMAKELVRIPPKKGLITDLDDTLWRGLIGEEGVSGVSFDLDNDSQGHGLFQQLLASLADSGVLIAIASKNSYDSVSDALSRLKLHIDPNVFYPIEAHWNGKSKSVERILNTWNIGAGDVVFVDDNQMELDEVRTRFPAITTLQFPTSNPTKTLALARQLRDIFGRARVSIEDKQRIKSIKSLETSNSIRNQTISPDEYIQIIGGKLSIDFTCPPRDDRAFELINKTNQFNLNGRRYEVSAWHRSLERQGAVLAVGSYSDKFGDLGRITVIVGQICDLELCVDQWVLSCRAFSRRVEHSVIGFLFDKFPVETMSFEFARTDRNGPMSEFMMQLSRENFAISPNERIRISRTSFNDLNWQLVEKG